MESKVERFVFRCTWRGDSAEFGGRIVEDEEGAFTMQMWMRSPQHSNILIEVAPVDDRDDLWPLFMKACEHRGVRPTEYRLDDPRGEWQPLPGD